LGLGQDCAVLISARVVAIEPHASTAFWDIARQLMAGLAGAQTLKGLFASRNALHRTVKDGIYVPTAAAFCAQAFAHEIRLTNLGHLPYGTEFGELALQTLWGPSVSARFEGAEKQTSNAFHNASEFKKKAKCARSSESLPSGLLCNQYNPECDGKSAIRIRAKF
jgi:hypothetical protein